MIGVFQTLAKQVQLDAEDVVEAMALRAEERIRMMIENREQFRNPEETIDVPTTRAQSLAESTIAKKERARFAFPDLPRFATGRMSLLLKARQLRRPSKRFGEEVAWVVEPARNTVARAYGQHYGVRFTPPRPFIGIPQDVTAELEKFWRGRKRKRDGVRRIFTEEDVINVTLRISS